MRKKGGMDSRVPAPDRAYAMILALLDGVEFSREQVSAIRAALPPIGPGRLRGSHCWRNHPRTKANTGSAGQCLPCARLRRKLSRFEMERFYTRERREQA